jgi:hypothetical protein
MAFSLPVLVLPVLVIAVAMAGLAVASLRTTHAIHGGRFEVLHAPPGGLRFRSDFGEFDIDRGRTALTLAADTLRTVVPLDRPARVEVRIVAALAPQWLEYVLGVEAFDLFGLDPHRIAWHVVLVVFEDGREIPVFAAGQASGASTRSRSPLGRLIRLRVVPDVAAVAQRVRATIVAHVPIVLDAGSEPGIAVGGA